MRQGWIIAWNGAGRNVGGWLNPLEYKEAVRVVESLIAQGIAPEKIAVNYCGNDHYSASAFLRMYGGKEPEPTAPHEA